MLRELLGLAIWGRLEPELLDAPLSIERDPVWSYCVRFSDRELVCLLRLARGRSVEVAEPAETDCRRSTCCDRLKRATSCSVAGLL